MGLTNLIMFKMITRFLVLNSKYIILFLVMSALVINSSSVFSDIYINTSEGSYVKKINNNKAECNDGKDNDGDGLTDWQLDLGCFGPNDSSEGGKSNIVEGGWTVFEAASETRIVYVSSSTGNDQWSGLAPSWNGVDGPKKSVKSGLSVIREDSSDWLLFKRGDVWKNEVIGNLRISGRSLSEPFIIASYGESSVRPRFEVNKTWLITLGSGGASENRSHVRILGVHIYMYPKDPLHNDFTGTTKKDSRCIQWLRDGGDVLLEDIKCEYAQISLQSNPTMPFTLRRSVLTGNYSLTSHAQLLFSSISSGLTLEENIFNHGGWNNEFRLAFWDPESSHQQWSKVSNGCFNIRLENDTFSIDGLDLTSSENMFNVAAIIESSLNKINPKKVISFVYTNGGAFKLSSDDYLSNTKYKIASYTGSDKCIDITDLLNPAKSGTPASTVFNRNVYIAYGFGKTFVRNNIDANGASGGIQQRMGGVNEGNLYLQNPISISYGANENPGGVYVGGIIRNNVILGGRNIDSQSQATGISIQSSLKSRGKLKGKKIYGHSQIKNLDIYGNIIANNKLGTGNVKGVSLSGGAPIKQMKVYDNIIYNWANNDLDKRKDGFPMVIGIGSGSMNVGIYDNIFQQLTAGYLGKLKRRNLDIELHNNTYWHGDFRSSSSKKKSNAFYFKRVVDFNKWKLYSGERFSTIKETHFHSPNRSIESYMSSLGQPPSFTVFMKKAIEQSKYNWDPVFTSTAVNKYIREGFVYSD